MTEPDPIAALAAHLEEMRGRLLRAEGRVGQVGARLETESGQVLPLLAEVKRLRGQLEDAIEKRQLAPPPAPWWCTGKAEGEAMLADLREWVETFLRRHYPAYAPATSLLGKSSRGGMGGGQPPCGVDPDLRRPG